MICPHCFKPISAGVTNEAYQEAKKLHAEGFSMREIEKILFSRGMQISFSSISRMLKGEIKKVKKFK